MIREERRYHCAWRRPNNSDRRYGALFGGGPSVPSIPAVPPAAAPATLANPSSSQAGIVERQQASAAAGAGFNNTLTNTGGAGGLVPPANQQATRSLLG